MMDGVWELDVWGPKIRRMVAAARADVGRDLTDEEFDGIVLASLDVLPVPVVQLPWNPQEPPPNLGRVGEALERLEAALLVRSMTCVDRRLIMRSSLRGKPLVRETVSPT